MSDLKSTTMIKYVILPFLCSLLCLSSAAQTIAYNPLPDAGGTQTQAAQGPRKLLREKFKHSVNISIGYGLPNLDKKYLPAYSNTYYRSVSQQGPLTGLVDYQFSRKMSIGILVTHGTVTAPYCDYFSSLPLFTARLNNWGFMFSVVRSFGRMRGITPYLHTAIGFNQWKQEYSDPSGNTISIPEAALPDFARQIALGAKFNLSKSTGLFVEAGYGKYIVQGGFTVKF